MLNYYNKLLDADYQTINENEILVTVSKFPFRRTKIG